MDARVRRVIVMSAFAFVLWGAGFVPFIFDRSSPVGAAQRSPAATARRSCIPLPDAVPSSAGARSRNPRVCPPVSPPVTEYTLRTTDEQSADPVWKTSYSANATYELFFALDVSGDVTEPHSYNLFIFMPSGLPYQAIEVTYTSTTCTAIGSACSVDQTNEGIRVWTSIPVAGTLIQQAQIYGTWTADAYIDGAGPDATTSFDIEP